MFYSRYYTIEGCYRSVPVRIKDQTYTLHILYQFKIQLKAVELIFPPYLFPHTICDFPTLQKFPIKSYEFKISVMGVWGQRPQKLNTF